MMVLNNMLFCLLLFGTVSAIPKDEFRSNVHDGDLSMNDDLFLKQIVPSGYPAHLLNEYTDDNGMPNVDDKNSENFKNFMSFVEKGVTQKGLIFNVYEDDMRNAAIALFRLLRETRLYNRIDYEKISTWAKINVNEDMYDYCKRLTALYSNSYGSKDVFLPPFLVKPNYFVNGETIMKALFLRNNYGRISDTVLKNYQIEKSVDGTIAINSNYSGWNIPLNGCDEKISYFKDDVALNSYYYGVQLLHPFWMSNEELDEFDPNHAEHYYFAHQQLSARYRLEKEHLGTKDILKKMTLTCESDYNPYLYYENGLAFPTRSSILGDLAETLTYIKSVDIAIKECIHRGLVIMENGTFIKVTSDNYINLMTKLIRANLDGIKSAKIIRSIFGYGNNGYPINKKNPTPSVLHHPQTTLRDSVYWLLIERGLDYFSEYANHTEFDISQYETDEFGITSAELPTITTIFENSHINLQKALDDDNNYHNKIRIFVRQRRLNHLPFTFNFTVESNTPKNVIVRLFLGPQCSKETCWSIHFRFFELDCYRSSLNEGINVISWNPKKSDRYSLYVEGRYFNVNDNAQSNYDIFKFPENLIIPKGTQEGLNLTVFIMITEDLGLNDTSFTAASSFYQTVSNKLDNKPLGFPFHKQAVLSNGLVLNDAPNYNFFNITVVHKKKEYDPDSVGQFSPHLY